MAYSVSKAAGKFLSFALYLLLSNIYVAGLHLMKCLMQTQGEKVRINAVLPGLLLTEWVCFLIYALHYIEAIDL